MKTNFRKRGAALIYQGKKLLSFIESHKIDYCDFPDILVEDDMAKPFDNNFESSLNTMQESYQGDLLDWYFDSEDFIDKYGQEQHKVSFMHIDISTGSNRVEPVNVESVIHIIEEIVNCVL